VSAHWLAMDLTHRLAPAWHVGLTAQSPTTLQVAACSTTMPLNPAPSLQQASAAVLPSTQGLKYCSQAPAYQQPLLAGPLMRLTHPGCINPATLLLPAGSYLTLLAMRRGGAHQQLTAPEGPTKLPMPLPPYCSCSWSVQSSHAE
jgi:hypothetical protein